jgi:hypothetical protein
MQVEDLVSVRHEMMELLRQQMEVLNSSPDLSDSQLMECYDRQSRVQDLRELLQAASCAECESSPMAVPDSPESNVIPIDSGNVESFNAAA